MTASTASSTIPAIRNGIDKIHRNGTRIIRNNAIGQEMAASAPERMLSLSLYSSFDRPDPYLRLRYDLLVRIALESSPEVWALFSAFSAFGRSNALLTVRSKEYRRTTRFFRTRCGARARPRRSHL